MREGGHFEKEWPNLLRGHPCLPFRPYGRGRWLRRPAELGELCAIRVGRRRSFPVGELDLAQVNEADGVGVRLAHELQERSVVLEEPQNRDPVLVQRECEDSLLRAKRDHAVLLVRVDVEQVRPAKRELVQLHSAVTFRLEGEVGVERREHTDTVVRLAAKHHIEELNLDPRLQEHVHGDLLDPRRVGTDCPLPWFVGCAVVDLHHTGDTVFVGWFRP